MELVCSILRVVLLDQCQSQRMLTGRQINAEQRTPSIISTNWEPLSHVKGCVFRWRTHIFCINRRPGIVAWSESAPRAGVNFNLLSCACSGAVLCTLWGVASVLFPLFNSLCRPRKLSVGLSRLMRSGTMERFNDEGARLHFQTTFTGHNARLQFRTSPSTHMTIKQVHNKISDRVKKKLHRLFVAVEAVSLPWQPPPPLSCPTPFLTPGNSRQSGRILVVSVGAGQPLIWAR